jgi:hypothetical protein
VLRHASESARRDVLAAVAYDHAGGWQVPAAAELTVDTAYLLFAVGLLAEAHPRASVALARAIPAPAAGKDWRAVGAVT